MENILPQFLSIISIVGITLIPGVFIAFPTAALLLQSGAGYMQMRSFISSLMMVGVITMPLEIKYFGGKSAFLRNIMAFLFSFLVALIIGKVMVQMSFFFLVLGQQQKSQ